MSLKPLRVRAAHAVLCVLAFAPAANALRLVNYNVTNYPGSSGAIRDPRYRTILAPLAADVVTAQEMTSQAGVNEFRDQVLNTLEPGQWAAATFFNGNDTDNALFYKPAKVQVLGAWSFYPNPLTNLRFVTVWRLKPVGYTASAAELRIYSVHLKASMGFETDRFNEAVGIRDSMNAMPPGTHAILLGDFNIYTSTEPAFGRFLESEADNDGRLYDPLNAVGTWNNNASFAAIHTQCPCLANCPAGLGFSGGGLDDRFDMFLPTLSLNNGTGLQLLVSTYKPVGNDAMHFNNDINVAPVIPEGQAYADALVGASDHLPVRVDIQLPAKISVTPAMIAFGTVITGATAAQSISVSNPATAPADNLDYSMSADAGFTAPGGSFSLAPGAMAAMHSISMSTAAAGAKSGAAHVSSDAVDAPMTNVAVSGTVLRHAVASLDGASTVPTGNVDFGTHGPGGFSDLSVSVFNRGYDALQALLAVGSGAITGGGGRFSIVGGFSPSNVGATPAGFTLHFDATGVMADSMFAATLTFGSADQPLPGATAQPNLVVALQATVSGATDVTSSLPQVTRLYAPIPNPPATDGTTLRYDLARSSDVRLDVYDVAGRRVAALLASPQRAGVHTVGWKGHDDAGRKLGAGVYFVRMSGPFATQTVRITFLK